MMNSCGMAMSAADLNEIIAEYDEDNNGSIDFKEFVEIFVQLVGTSSRGEGEDSEQSSQMVMESLPKLTESVEQALTERVAPETEPIELGED